MCLCKTSGAEFLSDYRLWNTEVLICMVSKAVNERRNAAMLERKKLKTTNKIQSGYLEYPAKLMVKSVGETKYKFFKEF